MKWCSRRRGLVPRVVGVAATRLADQYWTHEVRPLQSRRTPGHLVLPTRCSHSAIRAALASGGKEMLKVATEFGVGSGTVQRIKEAMAGG